MITEHGGTAEENMRFHLSLTVNEQDQEKVFPNFRKGQEEEKAESEFLSSIWGVQGAYGTISICDGRVHKNMGSCGVDKNCM